MTLHQAQYFKLNTTCVDSIINIVGVVHCVHDKIRNHGKDQHRVYAQLEQPLSTFMNNSALVRYYEGIQPHVYH